MATTEAGKCYAIWEVDGRRIPLLHGRRKSIVFASPDEAQKALERRGRRHPVNTRGLIYTIPAQGSAFDHEPARTVAL